MSRAGVGPPPRMVDLVPREARVLQGKRAGIVTRTAANIVDFAVVAIVLAGGYATWCAFKFLVAPTRFTFPTPSFLAVLAFFAVILFAYFALSWATTGRTYGDHLLALRVVGSRGEQLRWPAVVARAAFCVALPIGLFWAVVSSTNRSLQDSVLRTSVLYDWTTGRRPLPPQAGVTYKG
ncbi:MAG: RDD family protein [Dermatophilaceae bacterium]